MKTPTRDEVIEREVEAFRKEYACCNGPKNDGCDHFDDTPGGLDSASDTLRSALTRVWQAALSAAEGCVPPERTTKTVPPYSIGEGAIANFSERSESFGRGHNACRAATLQALAHLKGEPTK